MDERGRHRRSQSIARFFHQMQRIVKSDEIKQIVVRFDPKIEKTYSLVFFNMKSDDDLFFSFSHLLNQSFDQMIMITIDFLKNQMKL